MPKKTRWVSPTPVQASQKNTQKSTLSPSVDTQSSTAVWQTKISPDSVEQTTPQEHSYGSVRPQDQLSPNVDSPSQHSQNLGVSDCRLQKVWWDLWEDRLRGEEFHIPRQYRSIPRDTRSRPVWTLSHLIDDSVRLWPFWLRTGNPLTVSGDPGHAWVRGTRTSSPSLRVEGGYHLPETTAGSEILVEKAEIGVLSVQWRPINAARRVYEGCPVDLRWFQTGQRYGLDAGDRAYSEFQTVPALRPLSTWEL